MYGFLELALLDKERAVYNKMMADAVEADIEVLNWELKQKKDLLEGVPTLILLQAWSSLLLSMPVQFLNWRFRSKRRSRGSNREG